MPKTPGFIQLEAFHGTDKKFVSGLINDKFIYKQNDEHWLGNGAYFFADYSLAEWWTTNPTSKFGVRVKDRAIIRCEITVQEDAVMDLRKLSDFNQFVDTYREEFHPLLMSGRIVCKGVDPDHIDKDNKTATNRIRCFYCDYLKYRFPLKMIIGNFYKPDQPYLPTEYGELFQKFDITYIETQMCIFDQTVIIDKEEIAL